MVSLSAVTASNKAIATALPAGLVAVFVGATSGIGEFSLKKFAEYTKSPRIYFVGRSQEAADRIKKELKAVNPSGEYIFVKSDVSLLKNVDDVCRDIRAKEQSINLLFQSQGSMLMGTKTTEGLHFAAVLAHHSRMRFIVNLLPQLRKATALRRVINVLSAGKESKKINPDDLELLKASFTEAMGAGATLASLSLDKIAQTAPEVTFIHKFPGSVKTNFGRDAKGFVFAVIGVVFVLFGRFMFRFISAEECGERHTFEATSAKYPPRKGTVVAVPLPDGMKVAAGMDGKTGSGSYSTGGEDEDNAHVVEILAQLKKDGVQDKIWANTEAAFKRVTGSLSI